MSRLIEFSTISVIIYMLHDDVLENLLMLNDPFKYTT